MTVWGMASGRRTRLTRLVMTILLVLAAWTVLSVPLGVLVGSLFAHQRSHSPGARTAAPRVPLQAHGAA